MEESVVTEAKERKTVEVQNQAHSDSILRRERNRPHRVLATGSDSQTACLQRDPAALASFSAREEASCGRTTRQLTMP